MQIILIDRQLPIPISWCVGLTAVHHVYYDLYIFIPKLQAKFQNMQMHFSDDNCLIMHMGHSTLDIVCQSRHDMTGLVVPTTID